MALQTYGNILVEKCVAIIRDKTLTGSNCLENLLRNRAIAFLVKLN
jgi:hypothetical protein